MAQPRVRALRHCMQNWLTFARDALQYRSNEVLSLLSDARETVPKSCWKLLRCALIVSPASTVPLMFCEMCGFPRAQTAASLGACRFNGGGSWAGSWRSPWSGLFATKLLKSNMGGTGSEEGGRGFEERTFELTYLQQNSAALAQVEAPMHARLCMQGQAFVCALALQNHVMISSEPNLQRGGLMLAGKGQTAACAGFWHPPSYGYGQHKLQSTCSPSSINEETSLEFGPLWCRFLVYHG